VYGQNDAAEFGYGLAGRANGKYGIGVYAEATGPVGTPLALHGNGVDPPMSVDSSARVDNLNADKVDGASIVSNQIFSSTQNDPIIQLPGFGDFHVYSCDHNNAAFQWSSGGPNAYVMWWDEWDTSDRNFGESNQFTTTAAPLHFARIMLTRSVGGNTSMATVNVMAQAGGCQFAAQAVVQPG
jgi:hypothetical protein